MSDEGQASYLTEEYINRLKELNAAINAGKDDRANHLIGELTTLRESSLFVELGKLTREIHNSLNAFSEDERVVELAEEEIPDAKERLNFILSKTDNAAHRTMEGAEAVIRELDGFKGQANNIRQRWCQFRTRELSKSEFLTLSEDLDQFFLSVNEQSDKVKTKMTDIMLAQDYQDLTGQMIKQVIAMVQEIEEKMVRLVAISGTHIKAKKHVPKAPSLTHGPQLPTADKLKVASNQDEVDDLLASLGF